MKNIRQEVYDICALGVLPAETAANIEIIKKFELLYISISRPVTDDEARLLVKLFGSDGCFGLASSLMHLIETAPNWPIKECLVNTENEFIVELRNRATRNTR